MNNLSRLTILVFCLFSLFCATISSQTINVLEPSGGVYPIGSEMVIKWESEGIGPDVGIELTDTEFGIKLVIIDKTDNDGEFGWEIPDGTEGLFRVSVFEVETRKGIAYSEIFEIAACDDIDVNIVGSTEYCAGETIMLLAESPTAVSYEWITPLGIIEGPNVVYDAVDPGFTGNYTVKVIDADGCSTTATVNVIVHELPNAVISGGGEFCQNDPSPVVLFTGNGGTHPYTFRYNIDGGAMQTVSTTGGSFSVEVLHPTTSPGVFVYTLTGVKDDNNCMVDLSSSVTITIHEAPVASAGSYPNVCSTDPEIQLNGAIAGSASSGTWSGGSGTYSPNNTTLDAIYTPSAGELVTGSVSLTLTTDGSSTTICPAASDNTTIIISNGVQSIEISNSQSTICTDDTTMPLGGIVTLTDGSVGQGIWDDGGVGGTFTGGAGNENASYTPPINFEGPITLTLTALDPDGGGASNPCTGGQSNSKTITVVPNPDIEIIGSTSFCTGSSSTITVVETNTTNTPGDWTILWSTSASTPSISINQEINYSVTVTDANGCSAEASVIGEENTNIDITITEQSGNTSLCGDETATICADAGDYTYQWSSGETTACLSDVSAGIYSVTVTDIGSGCTGSDEIEITLNPEPTAILSADYTEYCTGEPAPDIIFNFTGTAPFDFVYTVDGSPVTISNHPNNTFILSGASTGTYVVTQLSDSHCPSLLDPVSNALTVSENPMPMLMITPENPTFCAGSSVTVTTTESFSSYEWKNGAGIVISVAPSIELNQEGNYSLTVFDNNGCSATGSFVVTEESSINVTIVGDEYICGNSSISLEAFPNGASVLWSNGSTENPLEVMEAGEYSVTVTDLSGCTGNNSVTIASYETPTAEPLQTLYSYCEGELITPVEFILTGNGPFSNVLYNYDGEIFEADVIGNSVIINNPQPGEYFISSLEDQYCNSLGVSLSSVVQVFELPNYSVVSSEGTLICEGTNTTLSTSVSDPQDYTYVWVFNGEEISSDPTVEVSMAGTYTVIVTNIESGCSSTKNIALMNSSTGAEISAIPSDGNICLGDQILLIVNNAATVSWEDPVPGELQNELSITVTPTESTTYVVEATNNVGCSEILTFFVQVNTINEPIITVSPELETYCAGTEVTFTIDNYEEIEWFNGATTTSTTIFLDDNFTDFEVTVSNSGCISESTVSLDISEKPSVEISTASFSVQAEIEVFFMADEIIFDENCSGISTYVWRFLDQMGNPKYEIIENDPDLAITFMSEDTVIQSVELVVVDNCGCESDVYSIFYEVRENGSCGSELIFPQSFCVNDELVFEAKAIPANSAGSEELQGYWRINGTPITSTINNSDFEVISIEQVNFEDFNELITVVFKKPQTFTINYFVDFTICDQTSPQRTFEVSALPEFDAITLQDSACYNEDVTLFFDYDSNVNWTLKYEVNGVEQEKDFVQSSSKSIKFNGIEENLTIDFLSLLDNETMCENKDFESEFVFVLEETSFEIVDTSCFSDLSYTVSYNISGGSGSFELVNSTSQGTLNGTVYTSGIIDDVGSDNALVSDSQCTELPNLSLLTDIECECLDVPVQYEPILYSACSSDIISPQVSSNSFLSHPDAIQYYDIFRMEGGQLVETIVDNEIIDDENQLSFSYWDDNGNAQFSDGVVYSVKVYVSTLNPVNQTINSSYRCQDSTANFTFRFFEDPTPSIEGAQQVCLNLQDVYITIDEPSNNNTYNWNFTPDDKITIEELTPYSYLLEFTNEGVSIDVEEIRIPANNLECRGVDSKNITITQEEAPEKGDIILFPGGLFVCDLPDDEFCFYWYSIDKNTFERTFEHQGRSWIGGESVDTNNYVYLCEIRNKQTDGNCNDGSSCASLNFFNSSGIYSGTFIEESDLIIYPNPAKDVLIVENIGDYHSGMEIEVMSVLGQAQNVPILERTTSYQVGSPHDIWKLDVSYLTNGVYFLQIKIEGSGVIVTKKFFVQ